MLFANSLRTFQHYRTANFLNELTAGLPIFLAGQPLCWGLRWLLVPLRLPGW
ncbi:hypothetical protein [Spirosoma linguale]|uniref:hypothetical protein n=1 Tax=Spirosoma linguale TaxID=108 RepID=UPI0001A3C7EC